MIKLEEMEIENRKWGHLKIETYKIGKIGKQKHTKHRKLENIKIEKQKIVNG